MAENKTLTPTEFDHDPYLKRIAELEVMVLELTEFTKILMWGRYEGNAHDRSWNLCRRAKEIVTDNKSVEVAEAGVSGSGW